MFQGIANFINAIMAALANIASIGKFASNPIGSIFGGNGESEPQPEETPVKTENTPKQTAPTKSGGNRHLVTIPEVINARFADTGSPAWKNQNGPLGIGHHYGTDFGGPNGTAVFNPYAMSVIKVGSYSDEGRKGDYIIGTLGDGTEYYTGHLTNVKVKAGDYVEAGTHIADIGYYNHTHVQLRINGVLSDFEVYAK